MLLLPALANWSINPKTESKTEECANHCANHCSRENRNKFRASKPLLPQKHKEQRACESP